jgi:hypothetical protein
LPIGHQDRGLGIFFLDHKLKRHIDEVSATTLIGLSRATDASGQSPVRSDNRLSTVDNPIDNQIHNSIDNSIDNPISNPISNPHWTIESPITNHQSNHQSSITNSINSPQSPIGND